MKIKNNFIKITKEDGLKEVFGHSGAPLHIESSQDMAVVFQISDIAWAKNHTYPNGKQERKVYLQKAGRSLSLELTPSAFNTLEEIIFKN